MDHPHLDRLLPAGERPPIERERLLALMDLFAGLPPPPDPVGLYPRWTELHARFLAAAAGEDAEEMEESFLSLYAHLHGHEAPYTPAERRRVDAAGGYWCHAGGLAPILKAPDHLSAGTVSGDFGAGNGLQGLLMQKLAPHARTVQIEISSRMVEAGRHLQAWLGIPPERVEWIAGDIFEASPAGMGFVYLYRPVRPYGPGRRFYARFAAELERSPGPVVIFSIADCLRGFLSSRFEVFYGDGHLTCFRRRL
ncbi:MAG: class I SAM-dependent methyltransferase [Planctomycetota bacterium]